MIGGLRSIMRKLAIGVALVVALSLAGASTLRAAPSAASGTAYVNGQPCSELCKAYMAWSDRTRARWYGLRRKARIAAHQRKPDQTSDRAAPTHHSDLNSFAQLLRRSDTAPPAAETPQATPAVPSAPVTAAAEPPPPATAIATVELAENGSATNEPPQQAADPVAAPSSETQATSTLDGAARSHDWRIAALLASVLCALLLLLCLLKLDNGRRRQSIG